MHFDPEHEYEQLNNLSQESEKDEHIELYFSYALDFHQAHHQ
jgi:hypothetical protein